MALNDQNRSRKTYSFFRAAPVPMSQAVTILSAGFGLLIEGNATQITYLIDDSIVVTKTGSSTFSGSSVFAGGLTGSLQQTAGGLSYLVGGFGIGIASQSNGQIIVFNTSALADVSASFVTIGNTGSLPNERALTAGTGISIVDNGSNSTVVISAPGTADVSASYITISNTGSLPNERALSAGAGISIADNGPNSTVVISAIVRESADVSASYITIANTGSLPNERALTAGTGISITDNGPNSTVVISAPGTADVSASYVTIGNTGSLPNERALSASIGLLLTDSGAGSTVSFQINDGVVATLSGATFTGPVKAFGGLSGSLQQISGAVSYLVAGNNISIASQSNGQILISGTTSSSFQWVESGTNQLRTSASVAIDSSGRFASSLGTDVYFFVSGTVGLTQGTSGRNAALFGGAVRSSGSVTAELGLSGSLTNLSNGTSYLVAGTNTSITSQSNGQVIVSWVPTSSLQWIESALTQLRTSASVAIDTSGRFASSLGTDVYFFISGSIDGVAGTNKHVSLFGGDVRSSGSITAEKGFSGSLTNLIDGTSYIVGASPFIIQSQSNGQIIISASLATTSSAGLQSAADKQKEDALSTSWIFGDGADGPGGSLGGPLAKIFMRFTTATVTASVTPFSDKNTVLVRCTSTLTVNSGTSINAIGVGRAGSSSATNNTAATNETQVSAAGYSGQTGNGTVGAAGAASNGNGGNASANTGTAPATLQGGRGGSGGGGGAAAAANGQAGLVGKNTAASSTYVPGLHLKLLWDPLQIFDMTSSLGAINTAGVAIGAGGAAGGAGSAGGGSGPGSAQAGPGGTFGGGCAHVTAVTITGSGSISSSGNAGNNGKTGNNASAGNSGGGGGSGGSGGAGGGITVDKTMNATGGISFVSNGGAGGTTSTGGSGIGGGGSGGSGGVGETGGPGILESTVIT